MDLALAIESLVPAAHYGGSTNDNNQKAYEALSWTDNRSQPPWDDIVAAAVVTDNTVMADKVSIERDRRIALGVTVQPAGLSAFPVQTRGPDDFRNIAGISTAAIVLKTLNPSQTIEFRDANDDAQTLTLDQTLELGLQVQAAVSAIYAASWAIKAMVPIPANYTDDGFWP